MREAEKSKLCPFKKITERENNGHTGKSVSNEKFAPCAGDRCMAYRNGRCQRSEGGR